MKRSLALVADRDTVPADELQVPPDVVEVLGRALGEALAAEFVARNSGADDRMGKTRSQRGQE